jgi:hypothetical protein
VNDDIPPADDAQNAEQSRADARGQRLTENGARTPEDEAARRKQENPDSNPKHIFPIRVCLWIYRKWTNPYRHRANVAEIITGLLTLAIAVVGLLQWRVYRQQKTIMEKSGEQTDQLIKAANIQACAATQNADSARSMAASAGIQSQATNSIDMRIKAAEADFQQLAKNATDTLTNTQDSFRRDQRAWLGVVDYHLLKFDGSVPMEITIDIVNSGKTPAIQVDQSTAVVYLGQFVDYPEGPQAFRSSGAPDIPPQGKYIAHVSNDEIAPYWYGIAHGQIFLYVTGRLTYHDIYTKEAHHTHFCLVSSSATFISYCPHGNTMD